MRPRASMNASRVGLLESWKENVAQRIDPEWGWHFACAAMIGCAGPLLRQVGLPSSAFYLHVLLRRQEPGAGYSNGDLGQSRPRQGSLPRVGSYPTLSKLSAIRGNDTTLAMDEARNAAAGSVGEFVFMFASGRGKNRAAARRLGF